MVSRTLAATPKKMRHDKGKGGRRRPSSESPTFDAVVFDGDDTLWQTQPLYEQAKDEFEQLCREIGLWDSTVRARIDAIDSQRVELLGFSQSRFPGSLVMTLAACGAEQGVRPPHKAVVHARRIGRNVFRAKAPLQPGVRSILRDLARRHRLILITKGEHVIQKRRLRGSGLATYFDSIYVVDDKTPEVLRSILKKEGVHPSRVLAVGDSLRSDIQPALAVGATAVWIPSISWRFERARLPRSRKFIKARALSDLRQLL